MLTQAQKNYIKNQLESDLSKHSDDRLIELCLLHRASPELSVIFAKNLQEELKRRYNETKMREDDVIFSTLLNFSNQFKSPIPLFHYQLQQMAASVHRDIWFSNNEALFRDNIADVEVMDWLLTQPSLLEKCLNNKFGLAWIAQSTNASTKILTHATAVDLWKQSTNLWQIWPQYEAGMTVLSQSSELINYVIANDYMMTAVAASEVAMATVVASETAMAVIVASEAAMTAVAASETAMAVVAASETTMATVVDSEIAITAVTESETALAAVVLSSAAKKVLVAHNTVLQSARETIYETIKTSWVKKGEQFADPVANVNPLANTHDGLVFATLGYFSTQNQATTMLHADGTTAATASSTRKPTKLTSIDAVSFKGCTFVETSDGQVAIEVWAPQ